MAGNGSSPVVVEAGGAVVARGAVLVDGSGVSGGVDVDGTEPTTVVSDPSSLQAAKTIVSAIASSTILLAMAAS